MSMTDYVYTWVYDRQWVVAEVPRNQINNSFGMVCSHPEEVEGRKRRLTAWERWGDAQYDVTGGWVYIRGGG